MSSFSMLRSYCLAGILVLLSSIESYQFSSRGHLQQHPAFLTTTSSSSSSSSTTTTTTLKSTVTLLFNPRFHDRTRPLFQSSSTSSSSTVPPPPAVRKTILSPGNGVALRLGDVATVQYTCYLPDDPLAVPVARSNQQKVIIGDGSMVEGWDQGIRTMQVGERALLEIPSALAYGATGVAPVIPPDATLAVDVTILQASPPISFDFDSLAFADGATPRTADQIAAAYQARQAEKSLQPTKEGLEAWLEKASNFYFFGFFEGETGQVAPWFLRPSITFPLAFALVGLAFYISYASGAITERGVPTMDELDEIVLPTTTMMMMMITSSFGSM